MIDGTLTKAPQVEKGPWTKSRPPTLSSVEEKEKNMPVFDWRNQAVAITTSDIPAAYPGGLSHPAGSAVAMLSIVSLPDGTQSTFLTPSAAALALSIAANSVNKAVRIKNDIRFTNTPGPDPAVLYQLVTPPDRVFDYFEHCFVGLVFSIQALEAYCNYKIAYDLKQHLTVERKGKRVDLSSIEIQTHLSLDDKLSVVFKNNSLS